VRLWKPVWRLKYATCVDVSPGCSSRLISGKNQSFLKQDPAFPQYAGASLKVLIYIIKHTAIIAAP
jgi:hypothetical protein